ncbi:Rne/Rng family ribonuclease [Tumebacillus sp. DT12]|uniref:Ribonuclease G n=1 Tax=Tumebacillus lacus TaxID=2995335 RepID=A0ABT3X3E7_9BACL|nr:Rne/Rng family ribonuclease [Tumebacillus lacus]MCX7571415.1 Rne/Rng family ribonuclease [Tumebacillus lacus]
MRKQIIISQDSRELRVAILEDGRTAEYYAERQSTTGIAGNIYKGRVANVLPGMQAAFIDIGQEKNAFLYIDDALSLAPGPTTPDRRPKIADLVREGQVLLVQVTKEAVGTKGARVTTSLSLPGRYLVIMPEQDYVGVSRRIESDSERDRIRKMADRVREQNVGVIVRTAAEGVEDESLEEDYRHLNAVWQRLQRHAKHVKVPGLVHSDLDLLSRSVRDFFTEDVEELWVDNFEAFGTIREIVREQSPQLVERVHLYRGKENLFSVHRIDQEVEKAMKRKVWLKSGGYLIIDQTEALTAIDINTGKFIGTTSLEETVLKTNLEAARELVRQIRLRDIGGIIIIDFIDMRDPAHKEKVVQEFEALLKKDRTRAHVLGITQLGLIEMTRKKVRQSLDEALQRACPYCEGRGKVWSEETMAARIERELREYLAGQEHQAVLVECHPQVAALLIGPSAQQLRRLESEWGMRVFIKGRESLHMAEHRILAAGTVEEVEMRALPVQIGQVVEVRVEEPHAHNPQDGIARIEGYVLDIAGGGMHVGRHMLVKISQVFRTYAKASVIGEA